MQKWAEETTTNIYFLPEMVTFLSNLHIIAYLLLLGVITMFTFLLKSKYFYQEQIGQ